MGGKHMSEVDASSHTESLEGNKDARLWAMICHLAAFAGMVGVPFGNVLGPLVIWLIKRDEYNFVYDQGREALNFQITVCIALLVGAILTYVLIGIVVLMVVGIGALILTIQAAINANKGVRYRYPFCIRFFK